MNIGEIEKLTSLTRANIRFYEREKLLNPKRKENSYRDYSEADVQTLLKIKLLRELGVSIEEIRQLQENSLDLKQVLEERIVSTEPHPWRRYFARFLDSLLYSLFFFFLYFVILHRKPAITPVVSLLLLLSEILLTLLIEPVLISRYGTTPGKWLMGICILDIDKNKLSWEKAFERTKGALWQGTGYSIPIYNLYCQICSFLMYDKERTLPWDEDVTYTFRRLKFLQVSGIFFMLLFCIGVRIQLFRYAELPRCKGEISLAEFARNYNDYRKYYDLQGSRDYYMDSTGQWRQTKQAGDDYDTEIELLSALPLSQYEFTEEDGKLTGVTFEMNYQGTECFTGYPEEFLSAVLSYVCAQKEFSIWNNNKDRLLEYLTAHSQDIPESYQITEGDITVSCQIDSEGYEVFHDMLILEDSATEGSLHIAFSMTKN